MVYKTEYCGVANLVAEQFANAVTKCKKSTKGWSSQVQQLAKAGLIDSSVRGVWRLTEQGRQARLDHEESLELFYDTHGQFKNTDTMESDQEDEVVEILESETHVDYRSRLLELLMKLPPDGFERLCQRILRELGFQNCCFYERSTKRSGARWGYPNRARGRRHAN